MDNITKLHQNFFEACYNNNIEFVNKNINKVDLSWGYFRVINISYSLEIIKLIFPALKEKFPNTYEDIILKNMNSFFKYKVDKETINYLLDDFILSNFSQDNFNKFTTIALINSSCNLDNLQNLFQRKKIIKLINFKNYNQMLQQSIVPGEDTFFNFLYDNDYFKKYNKKLNDEIKSSIIETACFNFRYTILDRFSASKNYNLNYDSLFERCYKHYDKNAVNTTKKLILEFNLPLTSVVKKKLNSLKDKEKKKQIRQWFAQKQLYDNLNDKLVIESPSLAPLSISKKI